VITDVCHCTQPHFLQFKSQSPYSVASVAKRMAVSQMALGRAGEEPPGLSTPLLSQPVKQRWQAWALQNTLSTMEGLRGRILRSPARPPPLCVLGAGTLHALHSSPWLIWPAPPRPEGSTLQLPHCLHSRTSHTSPRQGLQNEATSQVIDRVLALPPHCPAQTDKNGAHQDSASSLRHPGSPEPWRLGPHTLLSSLPCSYPFITSVPWGKSTQPVSYTWFPVPSVTGTDSQPPRALAADGGLKLTAPGDRRAATMAHTPDGLLFPGSPQQKWSFLSLNPQWQGPDGGSGCCEQLLQQGGWHTLCTTPQEHTVLVIWVLS
jgi:hypothetical protein